MQSPDREYTRDAAQYATRSEWVRTLSISAVLVIVSFFSPRWAAVVLALIVVLLVGWQIFKTYRRRQGAEFSLAVNRQIRAPDLLAERRERQSPKRFLVVGAAIETLLHSTLNSKADYLEAGWDPARVLIKDTKIEVDPDPILARIGGRLPLGPNEANSTKFVLSRCWEPVKDDEEQLTLFFKRTNWQIHNTVRNSPRGIEADNELALEFGSLDVEKNRVPSSVGLHFIVRFDDDSVLLLKRGWNLAHDKGKWSISAEEQFKAEDFSEGTLERVFRRALLEEVVGLYDKAPDTLNERWDKHVAKKIRAMRLWGLVFEEHACVTSLLGFYQFGICREKFIEWHKEIVDSALGTLDNEGGLYYTNTSELEVLLTAGACKAWPLFGDSSAPADLQAGQLAKTSRYRALRLVRAITGKFPSIGPRGTSILNIG